MVTGCQLEIAGGAARESPAPAIGGEIVGLAVIIPDRVDESQQGISMRIPPAETPPRRAIAKTPPVHEGVKEVEVGFPVVLEILKRPELLDAE